MNTGAFSISWDLVDGDRLNLFIQWTDDAGYQRIAVLNNMPSTSRELDTALREYLPEPLKKLMVSLRMLLRHELKRLNDPAGVL